MRTMVRGSLRLRLTAAVVFIVLVITSVGMILDYRREYRVHMDELRASLTEQAQALLLARKQFKQSSQFAQYVDDFCAQMNEKFLALRYFWSAGTFSSSGSEACLSFK